MPNNVVSKTEFIKDCTYRILRWTEAWIAAYLYGLQIPFIIVVAWQLLENYFLNVHESLSNSLLMEIVTVISLDLVKLGLFSTLIILFIKMSVILKTEIKTVWNILTPRYKEHIGENIYYGESSIFTKGYLPDSPSNDGELHIMKSRSRILFICSIVLYVFIQLVLLIVGEDALATVLRRMLSEGTTSELIFAIIGIPILFANITNEFRLSIFPTPSTALFFIEIGIPSTIFILGLRNQISLRLYKISNILLIEGGTYFFNKSKKAFFG